MNDCVPLKKCLYGTNSDFVILIELMNILETYIRFRHSFLLPVKADMCMNDLFLSMPN